MAEGAEQAKVPHCGTAKECVWGESEGITTLLNNLWLGRETRGKLSGNSGEQQSECKLSTEGREGNQCRTPKKSQPTGTVKAKENAHA